MSRYDYDANITFCTLAIGQEYFEKALTFVQSVMKFTNSDVYVVTDIEENLDSHERYFGNRLKFINIKEYALYKERINQIFNYHLKCIAIEMVYRKVKNCLVYVDADTFLFGWDTSISRYINGYENSLFCRFREKVSDNTSLAAFVPAKAEAHGVDYTKIDSRLAVEAVMVLTRGHETDAFIKEWKSITDYAIENDINPFIEAFELALALEKSKIEQINITHKIPFADNFRTVHNNKIITTIII